MDVIEIYEAYYGPLLQRAIEILGDVDQAMDVMQDVMLECQSGVICLGNIQNVGGFLYKVVRFKCLNLLREQRLHPFVDIDRCESDISFPAAEEIDDLLALLTPWGRRVLVLHDIEGYSCQEIACQTGKSLYAVRRQLTRSRQQLKQYINDINTFDNDARH